MTRSAAQLVSSRGTACTRPLDRPEFRRVQVLAVGWTTRGRLIDSDTPSACDTSGMRGLVSVSDLLRICTVTMLADAVLPLIRTRADLSRWSASNAHGRQMHEAVDNLEAAIPTTDPAEVYAVTHKALASAIKVIARADDSSGIIGGACRRLLELLPTVAAAAQVPASNLVDWMMRFQFDGERRLLRDRPGRLCAGTGQVRDGDLSSATLRY